MTSHHDQQADVSDASHLDPQCKLMGEEDVYLGDGVYGSSDGYTIRLYTNNGVRITNVIYLEPEVMAIMIGWLKRLKEQRV